MATLALLMLPDDGPDCFERFLLLAVFFGVGSVPGGAVLVASLGVKFGGG